MEELCKLLERHSELKHELRETEHRMADYVLNWKGTLTEAVGAGLVRFNFPAPPGLIKHLRKEHAENR